ncbi:MAG TPA: transposase [bacterium]|jgi:IS605 OrfB family transposase|nr:MAG: putative transposase DNA-binding domain protein [Bacteroidetes bacterium ADurb.Bin028]HOG38226.1 transposase [bacterium]
MSIPLTRKIKLSVYVPNTITEEKERHEYKTFVWQLLRKVNQQNYEFHNLLVKKLIELDSVLEGRLTEDDNFIEIRNRYYSDRKDKKNQREFFDYIRMKKDELIKEFGGKNLHGYIYTYLKNYIKSLPEEQQFMASYTYGSISKNVVDKYTNDQFDVFRGVKTIATYKNTQPIPINIIGHVKKNEKGELYKNTGKEWFNKYDDIYTFKFKSIKKHEIELQLNFGKDRSNNRIIVDRIYNNDPNYKICDSKIQVVGTEIFLLLVFKQFVTKRELGLDVRKVIGVDLGVKNVATIATNFSDHIEIIGEGEFVLMRTKLQIEKQKRSIQRNSKYSRGGHGRNRKLQKLNEYRNYERNFRSTFNHKISKDVIEIAIKHGAGQINIEDLSSIPLKEKNNRILRFWSYYDLIQKIIYKAKREGIIVNLINPSYTSQKCHQCGQIGNRPKQDTFLCTNPTCKAFNEPINADVNAAKNIAKISL